MNKEQHNDWDPQDKSVLEDQRQAYDKMRESCPVSHSDFMGWSIFRHEDISNILANPETYSNVSRFLAIPNGMDPPVLEQYREALFPIFNQDRMADLERSARDIAVDLVAQMISNGESEFVKTFAAPFALKTLCAFLGWDQQQWECLDGWVHGSQLAAFNRDSEAGESLANLFSDHVKTNLNIHRASPDNVIDATDMLLEVEVEGARLTDEQIVSILRNWAAGHGTVVAGLGILVLNLALKIELQDRLRSDPSLIPAAIEEILRVDGPLVANRRTTTKEVEIQGRVIPKGETLSLMWIAANRDSRAFDDPNVINIDRNVDASMVWGKGVHLCLGASLARLEMRVALEELLLRTKRFEVADGTSRRAVYPGNGLVELPLRLS